MALNFLTLSLIALSFTGGALVAAQGPIYARMASDFSSPIVTALVGFSVATIALIIITFTTGVRLPEAAELRAVPWWAWVGGLIGVFQVLVSIFAVPVLGVGMFMVVVVFGQLIASHVYDHFGLLGVEVREISLTNWIGLGLIVSGVMLTSLR
ncbi:MAG: DMT family transporter [Pseudomonadota bacterium]